MPINQCATINVPEPRMITVNVWDKDNISAVEKSIMTSGLGINPITEGALMRLPIPELNEERRRELSKLAAQFAEQSKVAVRNVRRDAVDTVKKAEKSSDCSKDDSAGAQQEIQDLTDKYVKKIDDLFKSKEAALTKI